ncbi:SDR family oxidoreductase [Umezawaea beigongshangensis]|uniref:SDR family oxidoreductase n=1 Tax=Umezawaea beigongshangensis TaxID=2780383 RepID=UPI0018F13DC6|nr:SDR family oxidoreductase [Umezawaea beigongshangensis]
MDPVRVRFVQGSDLRLRVIEQGDPDAPAVLLVHGYPDDSGVWDGVADELSSRFRVVRFDVRGHGGSDEPTDGYGLDLLAADIAAVARSTGEERVHLVGHDWGSVQSWRAASLHPELFATFTSISGPDLGHLADWVGRNRHAPWRVLRLLAPSWYIACFKVPKIPELLWSTPAVLRAFHASRRNAVNGLELYRANVGHAPQPRKVAVPVQQIALQHDPYVTAQHLAAAEPWAENLTRRPLFAGHWAPRTHPEHVARMIAEFAERRPSRRELVVVTGAGSGIGRATAEAFAAEGAEVVSVDVDGEAAARTAAATGGHAHQVDVTDAAAVGRLAEKIVDEHGVPDVVMANAGIAVAGPFLDTGEEDWRRVVDVNLWGVVHTLRAFAPHLVNRGEGGRLVVTSSLAGYFPTAALPAYSATKAAVLSLGQSLDIELKKTGVGVTVVCPGVVHTNITRVATFAGLDAREQERQRASMTRWYRLRSFGPEKVAREVVAAVRAGRLIVPVTAEAKLVRVLNRVAPSLVGKLGRIRVPG